MKLVLFGTGDFAAVAKFYLDHDSVHQVAAFTVSAGVTDDAHFEGCPIVPFEDLTKSHPPSEYGLFIAIAYSHINLNRQKFFEEGKKFGYTFPPYVCSKATTWPGLDVGEGSFIFEDNVIQPFTKIGRNCVLWSGNHIGHHSKIGDHVFIASHIVVSGNCTIENNCFLGVNATLRDGVTIGHHSVIGAGALVLHDIDPEKLVKGVRSEAQPMDINKQKI